MYYIYNVLCIYEMTSSSASLYKFIKIRETLSSLSTFKIN